MALHDSWRCMVRSVESISQLHAHRKKQIKAQCNVGVLQRGTTPTRAAVSMVCKAGKMTLGASGSVEVMPWVKRVHHLCSMPRHTCSFGKATNTVDTSLTSSPNTQGKTRTTLCTLDPVLQALNMWNTQSVQFSGKRMLGISQFKTWISRNWTLFWTCKVLIRIARLPYYHWGNAPDIASTSHKLYFIWRTTTQLIPQLVPEYGN